MSPIMPAYAFEVLGGPSDGTTNEWELDFAKRSLALLKKRLGDAAITDLLREDVAESDRYWKSKLAESGGKFSVAQTDLSFKGLKAEQFLHWFHEIVPDEPQMLAAHPEHYLVLPTDDGKGQRVLETLGSHVSYFVIPALAGQESSPFVTNRDESFPITMIGRGQSADGTMQGKVLHQFRNHVDSTGFDARLSIWFPAACEEDLFETHRRHLAVEFSNWVHAAYMACNSS